MWKFHPILKTTIWGGERILPYKGLEPRLSNIGESWEISGIPGSESVVDDGPDSGLTLSQLVDKYRASLLGERNYKRFGSEFPLLVKFIDARADLSVQVHPDDECARSSGLPNGKNEVWYVVEAVDGTKIANGFRIPVAPEEFKKLAESGEIEKRLHYTGIREGDIHFIPAGRVHAICSGALILEIQQPSDVTYRIYDYNRTDCNGSPRALHIREARKAIDFNDSEGHALPYNAVENVPVTVLSTPWFSVNTLYTDSETVRDYSESDTFVILVMVKGEADITCGTTALHLTGGHSVLIPASAQGVGIRPHTESTLIETYIR